MHKEQKRASHYKSNNILTKMLRFLHILKSNHFFHGGFRVVELKIYNSVHVLQ